MHAVLIESGGIVPLPRVGGALSHAVGSIGNLPRHCQTGFARRAVRSHPTKRLPTLAAFDFPGSARSYCATPAGGCGAAPAVVAAAASFRMRWWMVNSASSNRSDTPILSYTLRR